MLDLRTHIRNPKTGKVETLQPYSLHISREEGAIFVRDGVSYYPNGERRDESEIPLSIQKQNKEEFEKKQLLTEMEKMKSDALLEIRSEQDKIQSGLAALKEEQRRIQQEREELAKLKAELSSAKEGPEPKQKK